VTSTSCAAGPPAADRQHSAHNAYQVQLCRPGGRYKRGIPAVFSSGCLATRD
jgi:hypothetical protein